MSHGRGKQGPPLLLVGELLSPHLRQLIKLRPTTLVRNAPLGADEAAVFHPMQRRVQRALIHLEDAARDATNALRDTPSVQWAQREGLKNQEVQRALEKVGFWLGHARAWGIDGRGQLMSIGNTLSFDNSTSTSRLQVTDHLALRLRLSGRAL